MNLLIYREDVVEWVSCGKSQSPIHLDTDCDRICAIVLPLENHCVNKLIVLNVYFPSTDSDPTTFMQCTLELEAILNRYSEAAVVIAGDFNAHLGTLAGPRGTGPPNQRGFIVKDLIDRNNLFVASHSHSSTGPPITYHSGGTLSTIDYIIINRTASDILCSCEGLCDHSSNVSDHLPLSITLQVLYSVIENLSSAAKINWERAITTDSIHVCARAVSDYITPLLDSSSDDISQLDYEIYGVCEATCRIASTTLPHFSNSRKKTRDFYNDKELKHLCKASKSSWLDWKNAGRPLSGHLHEKRNSDKKRVRARLNLLRARQDRINSEHIDKNFRDKAKRRFRTPQTGTPHGTRLSINGTITLNQSDVISAWATHFEELGASKVNESSSSQPLQSMI